MLSPERLNAETCSPVKAFICAGVIKPKLSEVKPAKLAVVIPANDFGAIAATATSVNLPTSSAANALMKAAETPLI